jgi:hypothetical protein
VPDTVVGVTWWRTRNLSVRTALTLALATLLLIILAASALATPASRDTSGASSPAPRAVLVIGISGLRWTDISAHRSPELWRLATNGSVGSLVVSAVRTYTCPADAWLVLNAGARATATQHAGPCRLPDVIAGPGQGPVVQGWVPSLDEVRAGNIERLNTPYNYAPCWGLLGGADSGAAGCPPRSPAPYRGCATAIGPGAAIALSDTAGVVADYVADPATAARSVLSRCQLTVADLGTLPGTGAARAAAVRAADQMAGRLIAEAPKGTTVVVAGVGNDTSPHVQAIIVSGPGFGPGQLRAASTRQPGMVTITDLTPTILSWLGRSHAALVGSVIGQTRRGLLPATISMLVAQDTAAQVYSATLAWFFVIYGLGEIIVFAAVAIALRGNDPQRISRRRSAYTIAGVSAASVPAGTFLASLFPWPQWPHPAVLLYVLGLAWAALIAVAALAGPWRKAPFGPPGFVGAVTAAVIGIDAMTGSHLQLSTPFGLPLLSAGRYYGIGNDALGTYSSAVIFCATWAAVAGLRAGSRARALTVAGVIAVAALIAFAPAFGAKVGGTISLTPALALLLAAIAGIRVTPLRAGVIAISGLVLLTAYAVLSYLFPAVGVSDVGAFVGHVLHGTAGPILNRKVTTNLRTVTQTWFTPIVPVIVAACGLIIAWPGWFRLRVLERAIAAAPLLRPMLISIWTACALGWLADDGGVVVPAAALPFALPLAIVVVTRIGEGSWGGRSDSSAVPGHVDSEDPVQTPGRHS